VLGNHVGMRIVVTRDVDQFAAHAEGFVAQRLERNVLATLLMRFKEDPVARERAIFAYALDEHGVTAGAALRMPPWPLLAAGFPDRALADPLAALWLAEDPGVDAVTAEPGTARALSHAIATAAGGNARLRVSEAIHVLDEVAELPYRADGHFRVAQQADRLLLIEWEKAFARETGFSVDAIAEHTVDRRLAGGRQFVWDDGGPVSTAGVNPVVTGTARVGPVYTPIERRRHGYATSLVAALSAHALAMGAARCMLFTDLANTTSNKIYALIGYRRCGDFEEHAIDR
jgi:RimJ/RimL family protein N-acetyltransferase